MDGIGTTQAGITQSTKGIGLQMTGLSITRQDINYVNIQYDVNYDWEFNHVLTILPYMDIKDKFLFFVNRECLYDHVFPYGYLEHYMQHARDNHLHFKIICMMIDEAPSYTYHLKPVIDLVHERYNIPFKDFVIFSAASKYTADPVSVATTHNIAFRNVLVENDHWERLPGHHFISLARLGRKHRVLATVGMLERGLDKFGYMSLGSCDQMVMGRYNLFLRNNWDLIPDKFKHLMPMHVDDVINKKVEKIFHGTNDKITGAFVHVVLETSYEKEYNDLGTYLPNPGGALNYGTWFTPLVSEKSLKPMCWGQVPLILAHAGTVHILKDMGFDMFDDVIDHTYDAEPDGAIRIQMVLDQLENICNTWSLESMQDFKKQNLHRFDYNIRCFSEYNYIQKGMISLQQAINA
jgi:hypothetical protein